MAHDSTRVLVLGGSSEATQLVTVLATCPDVTTILSLAGRTAEPAPQPVPTRVGGFGGADGLAALLRRDGIDLLVDATHPFAERMAENARQASARAGIPLIKIGRPAWQPQAGDDWHEVDTMIEAVAALGSEPKRVFLTIGRLRLAAFAASPQHHYLIRTIDPIGERHGLPDIEPLMRRGPFDVADEEHLLKTHRIDMLVTKNSGGGGAYPKLAAARNLGVRVILLRRPATPVACVGVADALEQISAHRRPTPRGV